FHFVADADDRAVDGVNRNDADFVVPGAVLRGRNIAAAVFHDHFHHEGDVVREGGQDVPLVDNLHVGIGLDIGTSDEAGGVLFDGDDAGGVAVVLDHQGLHVEDDFGHVLKHPLDSGE